MQKIVYSSTVAQLIGRDDPKAELQDMGDLIAPSYSQIRKAMKLFAFYRQLGYCDSM